MKKLSMTIILSLAISLFLTGTILAQKGQFRKQVAKERIFEKLELTDAQQNQIEKLRYNHQMQAIDLHAELEKNQLEIKNLISADQVDESAVLNVVKQNNDIHNKLSLMKTEMMLKIRSILTPEQREKMKDLPFMGPRLGRGEPRGMGIGFGPCSGKGFGKNFDDDYRCRFRDLD